MEQTQSLATALFSIEEGKVHESRGLPNSKLKLIIQHQPCTRRMRKKLKAEICQASSNPMEEAQEGDLMVSETLGFRTLGNHLC